MTKIPAIGKLGVLKKHLEIKNITQPLGGTVMAQRDEQSIFSLVEPSFERMNDEERANFQTVMGAYRSFRGNRRKMISYVSMPITSGKRCFDVLEEQGVKTNKELIAKCGPDSVWQLIIQPNIAEGVALADHLGAKRNLLFIAPSVFEAKKWRWSQDAYMSLWYHVMAEMAGSHFLMDGWEYSIGGAKEVMFSIFMQFMVIRGHNLPQAKRLLGLTHLDGLDSGEIMDELQAMQEIRIYDAKGKKLKIAAIIKKLLGAIKDLRNRSLPYEDLLDPTQSIMQAPFFSPHPSDQWFANPKEREEYFKAREDFYAISA